MTELTDLSETDASNTTITTVNIAENCAPSGINNAIRATLGLIRRAFKSSIFRLRDSTDQTKLVAFDLSAITTATTRTITMPDADVDLGSSGSFQPLLAEGAFVDGDKTKLDGIEAGATADQSATEIIAALASSTAGAVGTYVLGRTSSSYSFGAAVAGSAIGASAASGAASGTLSGTWKCMGLAVAGSASGETTLFLRVA